MKRLFAILIAVTIALAAAPAFSASSIVPSLVNIYPDGSLLIKLDCTAHTDGTFSNRTIEQSDLKTDGVSLPQPYWLEGYYIVDAWTVNDGTTYPGSGAITQTDETGRQLIGASATDTLTLATTAYGVGSLTIARVAGQRKITSKQTVAVSDTGSAANKFTMYQVWRSGK